MSFDPQMTLNKRTGKYRMTMKDGDPVSTEEPTYEILTMLTESPGWIMEETPRQGPLNESVPEITQYARNNTPSALKGTIESRMEPLIADKVLVSAEVTEVNIGDGDVSFGMSYQRPGAPPTETQIELAT